MKQKMDKQEFIKQAIQSGYDDNRTNGWDWIEKNLTKLDDIFQSEEYKAQNGMKYKCMPFLIGNDELSELEKRVLETAWFLNNGRVSAQRNKEKIEKLNNEGFFNIENDEKLDKRKCEFVVDTSNEFFGGINKKEGKLKWSPVDNRLMAMKQKNRRRGVWVDAKNVYIKLQK